nr:LysR family transcriptional regulator [Pseudomonas sp. TH49]
MVAICESGSIQEASRLLHISQPALSKSIKEVGTRCAAAAAIESRDHRDVLR